MELHIKILEGLCRICGKKINEEVGLKYSKDLFYNEFGELFGVELNFDQDSIHPKFICKNDARVLYRYRAKKSENKDFSTDMVPVVFSEHSEECPICSLAFYKNKGGRPKKRKSGSVGIMHKEGGSKEEKKRIPNSTEKAEHSSAFLSTKISCDHTDINIDCIVCIVKKFCCLMKIQSDGLKKSIFSFILETIEKNDIRKLVYQIGQKERSLIKEDAQSFALMYRDLEAISEFDLLSWLKNRNQTVSSFFCGVSNCSENIESLGKDKLISLASSMEMTYQLSMPKLVSPFAFLQNICLYCISGSKIAVDLSGHTKPSGGYKTIYSWLYEQAAKERQVLDGDVMNVFDNEQIVGRKSSIKPKNKAKVSIITNKGVTQLDANGNLQKEEKFKPSQILKLKDIEIVETRVTKDSFREIVEGIMNQNLDMYNTFEALHYEQLHHFVNDALQVVMDEQKMKNEGLLDHIDESVTAEKHDKLTKCANCGMLNSKRKQICVGCKDKDGIKQAKAEAQQEANMEKKSIDESFLRIEFDLENDGSIHISSSRNVEEHERYDHIVHNHVSKKEIILTDPVFCNPNSFETVQSVLRQIGLENGIQRYGGKSRHWTCVCCDGIPYLICKKLKEEALVCTLDDCKQTFLSKNEFGKHMKETHPMSTEWRYIHEFDWFYLRIGSGHYEMNLMKSFFELNWVPFLEKLCEEMGFISDAAKLFAKNCKDLHKTWQLLLTFHFATLRELVMPYVRKCIQYEEVPSVKEFFSYSHKHYANSPNQKFLMDQVCRMSQGIINFRMATRRNNAQLLHSAKYMTKELFHARNHPKYQQIELYDHLQYLLMPPEVQHLHDNFASITTSGNPSSGQDFDFVLEEKNRELKQWISKGIPTDIMWQKICRNNILLEKIKDNTYSLLGLPASDKTLKDCDIDPAINAFRTVLRKSNYLLHNSKHTSVIGKELDDELVNYLDKASLKRMYFLKNCVLQEDIEDIPSMSNPVPVTPDERKKIEDINSMTKAQIEKEILKLLKIIQDPELSDYHMVYYNKKVKGKKKTDYVSVFTELKNTLGVASETEHIFEEGHLEELIDNTGNKEQMASENDLTQLIEGADVTVVTGNQLTTLLNDLIN